MEHRRMRRRSRALSAVEAAAMVCALSAMTTWHLTTAQAAYTPPPQLSGRQVCEDKAYNPLLPSQRMGVPLASGGFLPVFSSVPLPLSLARNPSIARQIDTIVVFLQDFSGAAQDTWCMVTNATGEASPRNNILTVAPWFGNTPVLAADWINNTQYGTLPAGANISLYFPKGFSTWQVGGPGSIHPAAWKASGKADHTSFGALDALLALLDDRARFPALQLITVAGFGAGAQTAQLYAWATSRGARGEPAANQTVVRFWTASANSYLYLSGARPLGACRAMQDTGTSHTCDRFATPTLGARRACPAYNAWGLGTALGLSASPYLWPLRGDAAAVDTRTQTFLRKQVVYVDGARDYCNCQSPNMNNPGSCTSFSSTCALPNNRPFLYRGCCDSAPDRRTDNKLDVTCAAMLQGSNRLQRLLNYVSSLDKLFGVKATYALVPNTAYDLAGFLRDQAFSRFALTLSSVAWPA